MPNRAYQGNGNYIFVSYSHKDEKKVYKFIEVLQQKYNVWYDEGIHVGKEWDKEIAERLISCSIFIFCITKNSLNSSNCMDEINHAKNNGKIFINVMMEDTILPDSFMFRFSRYQMLKLFEYEDIVDGIVVLEKNCDEIITTIKGNDSQEIVLKKPKKRKKKILITLLFLFVILITSGVIAIIFIPKILNDSKTVSILEFKDGYIDGDEITYVVDNQTSFVSISDKIKLDGNGKWNMYYDNSGLIEIKTKVAAQTNGSLDKGDNIFYIFVYSGKNKKIYTLNVHRSRKININYYYDSDLLKTEQIDSGYDYIINYNPSINDKTFNYWTLDDKYVDIIKVFNDTNLYALVSDSNLKIIIRNSESLYSCTAGKVELKSNIYEVSNNDGYTFLGWFKDNKLISIDLNLKGDDLSNYEARWINYTLTVLYSNIEGIVSDYNEYNVSSENTISLSASPNDGFSFVGWYIDDLLLSTESNYDFTMPYKNVIIKATFEGNMYELNINNYTDYSILADDNYKCNEKVSLTLNNYTETNKYAIWKLNGKYITFGTTFEFDMPNKNSIVEVSLEEVYTKTNDNIFFGKYPQTKVTSEDILNQISESITNNTSNYKINEFDDFSYYSVDLDKDGTYDYFGSENYWYYLETIKWNISSTTNGLYIYSDLILDAYYFIKDYDSNSNVELNYKSSDLRKYINDFCYDIMFNDKEKLFLKDYLTDENTYDKLFIPLVSESISSTGYSSQYAKNLGAPCDDEMYEDYPQPYPMGGGDTFYPRDDGFNWWIREVYEDENMVHAYTSNYYKSYHIPPYCYVGIRFSCVLDI